MWLLWTKTKYSTLTNYTERFVNGGGIKFTGWPLKFEIMTCDTLSAVYVVQEGMNTPWLMEEMKREVDCGFIKRILILWESDCTYKIQHLLMEASIVTHTHTKWADKRKYNITAAAPPRELKSKCDSTIFQHHIMSQHIYEMQKRHVKHWFYNACGHKAASAMSPPGYGWLFFCQSAFMLQLIQGFTLVSVFENTYLGICLKGNSILCVLKTLITLSYHFSWKWGLVLKLVQHQSRCTADVKVTICFL